MNIRVDICKANLLAEVTIKVDGFPSIFQQTLIASKEMRDYNEFSEHYKLDLGDGEKTTNGYLPLSGGNVSLYAWEDMRAKKIHLMVC